MRGFQGEQRVGVDIAGADADQEALFALCHHVAVSCAIPICCYHSSHYLKGDSFVESVYSPDTISMEEEALSAIRRKRESSLVQGLLDVKAGRISALVTCANTGAVTAAAVVNVKRFARLHHPALIAVLPLAKGPVVALDMGAFVTASSNDLFSYAKLGSAYATLFHQTPLPRVGLLNIGRERGRGTTELKQADRLISQAHHSWQYVGNVEPSDVCAGGVDVLVTAGFAGNIFLKTAEAISEMGGTFSDSYKRGALLAGVKGIVIKCHGSSTPSALKMAIQEAVQIGEESLVVQLEQIFVQDWHP